MASRFSLEAIFKAVDQFSKPLSKMSKQSKTFTKTLKTDFAKAQRDAINFNRDFSRNMKTGLMIGLGAAITGAGIAIKQGIDLASDLTEVQNVVDTSFGNSSKAIDEWSKTAIDRFGLSELQAKNFAGTMGAMLKSSDITGDSLVDMSSNISGLAGGIASFRNIAPEEAFEKLQSIVTGTTKPLRSLGINMTVASLEAWALSKGITKSFKSMTQAEQVQLRYNFVMDKTRDMYDDFNKTLSTSFANQKRVLSTKFNQKLAAAMIKLIPYLIKVWSYMNKFLDTIDADKLADNVVKGAKAVFNFAKGLYKVFKIVKPFIPLLLSLIAGVIAYNKAMFVAAQLSLLMKIRMNPLILAIGILIFLIYSITKNWKKMNTAQKALIITIGSIIGIIGVVIGVIKGVIAVYKIWQAVQIALNIAMTANPIGAIIMGITAMIAAIILAIIYYKQIISFVKKWWEVLKILLTVMFPFYSILVKTADIIKLIITNWNNVKEVFKSKGMIAGIIAIGKVILDNILKPIQMVFGLLSKIPKIGKFFGKGSDKIGSFREKLDISPETPITPSERSSITREEKVSKGELTIKDQTGRGELKQTQAPGFNIKMATSGGF